ncbi:MAG TPA: uracil-DNA glycosylase family protein [Thermoanaerobaculia bacterium]|jgi:uracil-DNA glycosylase|nr:uracil-DNA glycosylase family protein [Thermoanaerobaculia bacterium]
MVQHAAFAEHVALLTACAACPNVIGRPVVGAVAGARVMLVGQAPGPHEADSRRPFAYTAGRRLFGWMSDLGVDEATFRERVHISAVIRCFPGKDAKSGGDRVPDDEEIARCGAHLDREITILKPKLVIAVGTLASQQLIGIAQLKDAVGRMHRAKRAGRTFDVVVLPHPSGRSTWLNKPENASLMRESLRLIAEHPAFEATFRPRSQPLLVEQLRAEHRLASERSAEGERGE